VTPLEMPPEGAAISQKFGFRDGDRGAHSARTMMLEELERALIAVPAGSPPEAFSAACVDANALGKQTMANRKNSLRNLVHLYALDEEVPLFRVLRRLWPEPAGRPLLALLLALARDPLLRLSAPPVLRLSVGAPADRDIYASVLARFSDRFTPASQKSIAQNFASTWTHSGHVRGVMRKFRNTAKPTPHSAAFAVTIAYLVGLRGVGIMESTWLRVLDAPNSQIEPLLAAAARADLIEFKSSGQVIVIKPSGLLTPPEMALAEQLAHERSIA
jgi:hypothetical protein